ncbi:aminoglycoside N(3)-acetyltransferase [Streptomyces sp. CA-249302]|uniref:aminoglycoside N(3)-acetyltransferase n=1 Tax=Streptomyces sp. CA-249302 TaxID=3240058 RepID=UPI003D928524
MAEPAQLTRLFSELGVARGGVLLVHASLGGSGLRAVDVRDVLLDALGPDGTLVVPAFTPENSDTSRAHRALIGDLSPPERARFLASMLPYNPDTTPCPTMGTLATCIRTSSGAIRSTHPQTSFAAIGRRAAELMADHDPHCHLGERSPLAKLYAAGAQILLFRVGFEVCSAFHLAQYRTTPPLPQRTYRCVVGEPGHWISYEDIALDDHDFAAVGAGLPREQLAEREVTGRAVRLFAMRAAVDHALTGMSGFAS